MNYPALTPTRAVCNVGGFAVAVVQIGNDIALGPSQLVWVSPPSLP